MAIYYNNPIINNLQKYSSQYPRVIPSHRISVMLETLLAEAVSKAVEGSASRSLSGFDDSNPELEKFQGLHLQTLR